MPEKKPNVYIKLFNGRTHPDEILDDWGLSGPVFGPFVSVQITYGFHIKLDGHPNGFSFQELFVNDGLVYYDKVFYGDFIIFSEDQLDKEDKGVLVRLDEAKTKP